jgi:hypothetical protein
MRETPRAKQAWADYLAAGPGRSLDKLLANYQSRTGSVPTRQLSRLKRWSADYQWQLRLQQIADQAAAEAQGRELAYRRGILEDGYGLAHERVASLKRLAAQLEDELLNGGRLWVRDVKQLGAGPGASRVDIERFNSAEVAEFRALLDDIAKEKGERAKKMDVRVTLEQEADRLAAELGIERELALREVQAVLAEGRA